MSLRFDHPQLLYLGLLAIPLLIIGWRAMRLTDRLRRAAALGLRAILLLALTFILAGPHTVRQHHHLTVIGVLDISGSVQRFADLPEITDLGRRSNIEYLRQWFRRATQTREPDDRFGLVVFDGRAIAISAPTRGGYVDDNLDVPIAQGTDISQAIELAIAMFPADTAKRLVLVSDGNETAGNVLEAVEKLRVTNDELRVVDGASFSSDSSLVTRHSSLPIDVLPIAYHIRGDVQVARVEAPPTAQPGQTVTVRIILEAASPADGSLTLRREGVAIDLNGAEPGTSRQVQVPVGQSVHLAQVALGETPINRFEAVFEADDPADNVLPDNDRAEAFTATPSKGSVLIISNNKAGQTHSVLGQILADADLPVQTEPPSQLPDDLLSLQNHDLIVLDNIAAFEVTAKQQEMLSKYVNDLGGGLIVTGGENSFGAGGWNGTVVENLLPLELDPSKELLLPTAALVLVLDKSGSMNTPVAGARASQQTVANEGAALAIESLRSDSLVGVVTFDMFARVLIPLQANDDPKKLAERVRSIRADGGTNLEPGLLAAQRMLKDVKVAKKRVVCMSDGRSHTIEGLPGLAKSMADQGIQVSAIAVGDDADHETMKRIAELGGGTFYAVRDPRKLPLVLVDSVQMMNKPLLKEAPFSAQVVPTGSTLTAGMESAPQLGGLVITSVRNDPKVAVEMLHPEGEPLLAHWQAGLGRVAAFTSAAPGSGAWSQRWIDWPTSASFWTQLARVISRPATSQNAELLATIDNDRLRLTLDIAPVQSESQVSEYVQVDGTVYRPDGSAAPVRLRQTAPGRYQASVEATLAGNYIAALNPRQGSRQLAPVIGGVSQASSPEFRRYSSNMALLEEIVQATGGRRLEIADPLAIDLFDRSTMRVSISFLPAWRIALLWTLALLLLDVACRRLAWDYNLLGSWFRRVAARAVPWQVRGAEAAATLATLRRVSDEVEGRRAAGAAGLTPFAASGRIQPPPERDLSPLVAGDDLQAIVNPDAPSPQPSPKGRARMVPEPSKVAAALDALLGRSKPGSLINQDAQEADSPADRNTAAAQTTSNLLAAKRRARDRLKHVDQGDTANKPE